MSVTPAIARPNGPSALGVKRAALLLLAIAGSYVASNTFAGWAARLLVGLAQWQAGEAVILTSLTAIVACAALVVWVFSHRGLARAIVILFAWSLLGFALDWIVPVSFGSTASGMVR